MKYFQITGKTTDEIAKKLLSDYNGRAYIIKLVKESENVTDLKKWYHKGFVKPKSRTEFFFRAYCSLPENDEDKQVLEDLQNPPAHIETHDNNNTIEASKQIEKEEIEKEEIELVDNELVNKENKQLQADIQHLKDMVNLFITKKTKSEESLEEFLPLLLNRGFSYLFVKDFLSSLQTTITDWNLLKLILKEKLKMKIKIEQNFSFQEGDAYIFLGSTGVGKTTTLAKLAALCYKQGISHFQFVSFDSYRLGADEQLKRFADIFEKPFTLIQNESEMKNFTKKIKKKEILFLDTAGESIQKELKIPEVLKYVGLLNRPIKYFLVLDSHTRIDDLLSIKKQFHKFPIHYYIFTKLDEVNTIGSILEFLAAQNEKILFYTDGQAVPNDIKEVNIEKLFDYI